MRFTRIFVLVFAPLLLIAEEAVPPQFDPSTLTGGQAVVYGLIVAAVGWVFAIWRKRMKAAEAKDIAATGGSIVAQRGTLLNRVEDTALRVADQWAEDNMPALLTDALDGGDFDWKYHSTQAFKTARSEVIQCFKAEGIDLVARLGAERLNGIVKKAVFAGIKKLPEKFQGFLPDAVVAYLTEQLVKFVTAKTADWVKTIGD